MTALYIDQRPFPGHVPLPPPDPAKTAAGALAQARRKLAGNTVDCPSGCRCSVWCRDEWDYAGHAIGACEACGEPCRSTDPEGRKLHPTCDVPGSPDPAFQRPLNPPDLVGAAPAGVA